MDTARPVVLTELKSELYLAPQFPDRAALEREIEFWDATTAQWVGDCPRRAEYAIRYNIVPKDEAIVLAAGRAIHAALAVFYATRDVTLALTLLRETFGRDADWRLPPGHRYAHLHLGHIEIIFKNYVDFAERRDTFEPLHVTLSDLDLTDVLAAQWLIAPDGKVILGESKVVMRFDVPLKDGTSASFVYAGKPDLPIRMSGSVYLMDHKSTNAYLAEYWAEQWRYSNQLRGYCAMFAKLLPSMQISGAMINGIHMGEKASLSFKETKANKFARYGPYIFQPAHLAEAIRNQYLWRQNLDWFEQQGYYPQHASKLCGGCPYSPLCEVSPRTRTVEIRSRYQQNSYSFLEL